MKVRDNKYIPQEDRDFFILLRIGLWQKVEEPLSPSPDWPYIYRLSCEQTVQGIVADGVALYKAQHPDLQITQEQNDLFLSATAQIVRRNYQINQLQARICQLFADNHIQYVVLKGQAVAQAYPKPMLRVSGDIDYLVQAKDYNQAVSLLETISTGTSHIGIRNIDYSTVIEGIDIELHVSEFSEDGDTAKRCYLNMVEELFRHDLPYYNSNNTKINFPNPTFNALYVFLHYIKHYYTGGIGLRQLCDWILLLKNNQESIDFNYLQTKLKVLRYTKEWDIFICFAREYIAFSEAEHYSLQQSISYNEKIQFIWQRCKQTGNFAHNTGTVDANKKGVSVYYSMIADAFQKFHYAARISYITAIRRLAMFFQYYIGYALKKLTTHKQS